MRGGGGVAYRLPRPEYGRAWPRQPLRNAIRLALTGLFIRDGGVVPSVAMVQAETDTCYRMAVDVFGSRHAEEPAGDTQSRHDQRGGEYCANGKPKREVSEAEDARLRAGDFAVRVADLPRTPSGLAAFVVARCGRLAL